MKPEWRKNRGNEVLNGDGFYISFNPKPVLWPDNGAETALVLPPPTWKCLILNGDYRKEYGALVEQGYEACLAFYESKKSTARSSWSEDKP